MFIEMGNLIFETIKQLFCKSFIFTMTYRMIFIAMDLTKAKLLCIIVYIETNKNLIKQEVGYGSETICSC